MGPNKDNKVKINNIHGDKLCRVFNLLCVFFFFFLQELVKAPPSFSSAPNLNSSIPIPSFSSAPDLVVDKGKQLEEALYIELQLIKKKNRV